MLEESTGIPPTVEALRANETGESDPRGVDAIPSGPETTTSTKTMYAMDKLATSAPTWWAARPVCRSGQPTPSSRSPNKFYLAATVGALIIPSSRSEKEQLATTLPVTRTGHARWMGFVNILKTIVGTGTTAVPYGVALCGYASGTAMILLGGCLTAYSLFLLSCCAQKLGGQNTSFSMIARRSFPWASAAIDIIVLVHCGGAAISYIIIAGKPKDAPLQAAPPILSPLTRVIPPGTLTLACRANDVVA